MESSSCTETRDGNQATPVSFPQVCIAQVYSKFVLSIPRGKGNGSITFYTGKRNHKQLINNSLG